MIKVIAQNITRRCGECTLCCKLMPMQPEPGYRERTMITMIEAGVATPEDFAVMLPEWEKPAGERCKYQRHGKGCTVYRQRPFGCKYWNCRWLVHDDTADLARPDRSHVVIDMMPDLVRLSNPEAGLPPIELLVVVLWIDPNYPLAHKDPALRRYLLRRAERDSMGALFRYSSNDTMLLLAPPFTTDGRWMEKRSPYAASHGGFKGLVQRIREENDRNFAAIEGRIYGAV